MYLVGNVLFDADELVTAFVRRQLPHAGVYASDGQPLINATLGVVANGRIVGGVLYFNWRRHDIEIAAAFNSPLWARPETLRTLTAYPFAQLGCVRATAVTARGNRRARRVLQKLGFRLEGVKRQGFDGRQDAMLYGLMRSDCQWLKHDVPVTLGLAHSASQTRVNALVALDPTYSADVGSRARALDPTARAWRDPTPT